MNNKAFIVVSIILIVAFGYYWFSNQPSTSLGKTNPIKIVSADKKDSQNNGEFLGEKGTSITLSDNQIQIANNDFETNKIRYFNTEIQGKKIYFMVVKDEKGTYRAAANACEICFGAKKGFRQEGDFIVCNNCQNRFALNTLGIVRGGCNPGPISADIKVIDENLIISSSELGQVTNLF